MTDPRVKDETGNAYHCLTVLRRVEYKTRQATWVCQCVCGETVDVNGCHLRNGVKKSCGCQKAVRPQKPKLYVKPKGICSFCNGPTGKVSTTRCRTCKNEHVKRDPGYSRNWQLQKKYGISLDDFNTMWEKCNGNCEICGSSMKLPVKRKGQPLDVVAVDHDHETGKVRGLLCNACNKAIGLLRDNIEILTKAKEYLKCHAN